MERAVIFDWDGVVVDSSAAHERSWELLAEETGLPLPPDHMERGFGRTNATIIPEILNWTSDPAAISRLSNRKEELYRELLLAGTGSVLPGIPELLRSLQQAGVPCAVGSSTDRANILAAMERFSLRSFFAAVASAEDVERGKPDPQVFLTAAAKLEVPPAACIVMEDSPHGIEAARRAGMKSVALLTSHPRNTMAAADRVYSDPSALSLADLLNLLDP